MTSLLERLRELDEKATPGPWWVSHHPDNEEHFLEPEVGGMDEPNEIDAELTVALRNALPAVVALVEAAQEAARLLRSLPDLQVGDSTPAELLEDGVAPFVSEATQ